MNTGFARPTQEELETESRSGGGRKRGYPAMLWIWPMAVQAGVVPSGSRPEEIFEIARDSHHKQGTPKFEALQRMLYAAVWHSYASRRMQWPNYRWAADARAGWGPPDAMTERSRIRQDELGIHDVMKLTANALYAAESTIRVALSFATKARRQTSPGTVATKTLAKSNDEKVGRAAEPYRYAGRNYLKKGDAATRIATEVNMASSTVQKKLSELFPGKAWKIKRGADSF